MYMRQVAEYIKYLHSSIRTHCAVYSLYNNTHDYISARRVCNARVAVCRTTMGCADYVAPSRSNSKETHSFNMFYTDTVLSNGLI